jgi:hypothetical protein
MATGETIDRWVRRRRLAARLAFGLVAIILLAAVVWGVMQCSALPHESGGDSGQPSFGAPPDNVTTITMTSGARALSSRTGAAACVG